MSMQEYEKYGAPLLDRKSEIDELIKTPKNQYPLEINGKLENLPVIRVRIQDPIYRLVNGRTKTMQEEYLVKHPEQPTDLFTKDEGSYAAQKAQHEILCKLAADADLMKEFKDGKEQTEPIICTVAGVVVNGNRRLCAWRTLYYGDSKKYSHFEYVNIAIIPRECDEESIKNIERKLQIQKTLRADYKWHAKAMMMKQDQAEGTGIIELTEKYDMKNKKETGIFLAAFDYAGEYLEKTGRAKQWSIVDGDEFSFRKFAEERKKISEQDKKELFETLVFQLIQNHSGYSGRLYDIIPDIAKNLDAIYEDMKAKMEAVETQKGETEEESEKEQSGKAEGVSTDTDNDTAINNGDGDDLDLLGGEAIETGKYAKVTKAIQNGVIDNVSEIVTNTLDNQKALQAEAKTSGFLIGQLSKASSYLQNAVNNGLTDKSDITGVSQQIKNIEDSLKAISDWLSAKEGK